MLNSCSEQINVEHINHEPKESSKKLQNNHFSEIAFLMRFDWENSLL